MVEFYLILSAVNPTIGSGMFLRLMIGTVCMILFGYLGESQNMEAWLAFALGMCGWFYILSEIFVGEAGKAAAKIDSVGPYVKEAFGTCRFIVTVGWSIYPLGSGRKRRYCRKF